jgi:hypothetical protein
MAIRMQQRQGTADQWLTADPVLGAGEIGFETDTNSFKIGDGVNSWNTLDYFTNETGLAASLSDYILSTEKAAANGVATLDASGFVPAAQLNIDITSDINAAVAALVDGAPATLDTLNELAAAIGDNADFITTVNTSIGLKQDKVAGVTDTEIGYLDGVTSALQTQIDDNSTAIGNRVSQTDGTVTTATVGSTVIRNITLSTATPGGAEGSDGDVWLMYTP